VAATTRERVHVTEHLEELRHRLIVCVVAILCAAILSLLFSRQLLQLLLLPMGGVRPKAFGLMDGFLIQLRVALYAGAFIACPIILRQLYCFVRPALYPHERKAIAPLLYAGVLLFLAGAAFGYYLLGDMVKMLIWLYPPQVEFLPSADSYLSFALFFLLATGLVFLFPTVIMLLVKLRILSTHLLYRQRKIVYFMLFVIAELITPVADPIVAPLTIFIPLGLLFEGTMLIARGIERRGVL
jgi:sec-independent protein translocase protein TatC